MDEYVNPKTALCILQHFSDKQNANQHFLNGIETAKEVLESMPREEVRPVVHGRWQRYREGIGFGFEEYGYFCTHCKIRVPDEHFKFPPEFCPHCGAIMDLKDKQT